MINTLGKNFFAAATFKALWDAFFEIKKLVVYFVLHQSFFHFSRREDQENIVYRKYM